MLIQHRASYPSVLSFAVLLEAGSKRGDLRSSHLNPMQDSSRTMGHRDGPVDYTRTAVSETQRVHPV